MQRLSAEHLRPRVGTEDGVAILTKDETMARLAELAPQYARLNTDAFALAKPTSLEEADTRLAETDLLLLAYANGESVGFATYQIIPSDMGTVIYQARGLLDSARGLGLGRRFPQIAADKLRADFLIAKAQNPISIWSTMASGLFDKVYPIEDNFAGSDEMGCVLLDTVAARGKLGEVDLATGLHLQSYPMGKLGDYTPRPGHPGVTLVQTRLAELGVDASRGDAVYYGGKINKS